MKSVLFYRHFDVFSGGHLKLWDYFSHFRSLGGYEPHIRFSPTSLWDQTNPWLPTRASLNLDAPPPSNPDLLFIAGKDWDWFDAHISAVAQVPVLNLIQHVRHADPQDRRYRYLRRRAIRICVSEEVADAVRMCPQTNGPVVAIPNGIGLPNLPAGNCDTDLLIVATKNPELGRELQQALLSSSSPLQEGMKLASPIKLLSAALPRDEFLSAMAGARIVLFLPNATEGFYLPALEAMALQRLVICPDCIGNRSFCLPGRNCLFPIYQRDALLDAVGTALAMDEARRKSLLTAAAATAAEHSLLRERQRLAELLANIKNLW